MLRWDRGREVSILSEHATIAEAFADAISRHVIYLPERRQGAQRRGQRKPFAAKY
jgi:hypothetical protein